MRCGKAQRIMNKIRNGDKVKAENRTAVAIHITDCEKCKNFEGIMKVIDGGAPPMEIPPFKLSPRVKAEIEKS